MRPTASFDAAHEGYRFSMRYRAPGPSGARATVIVLPPLAEELNRCRRMIAKTARAFCSAGYDVLQRDPLGCGDSTGDFGDARWEAWLEDVGTLIDEAPDDRPLWLWAIRAGALMVPALVARRKNARLLLWQPALSGQVTINQWLRVRTSAGAMNDGAGKVTTSTLRCMLAEGQALEIGGYLLSPALVNSIDATKLDVPANFEGRVVWFEVAEPTDTTARLTPAGDALRAGWVESGIRVDARAVSGLRFWQTQETSECDPLIEASLAALTQHEG